MLADWRELNFMEISKMSVFVNQQDADPDNDLIKEGNSNIAPFVLPIITLTSFSCLGDGAAVCEAVAFRGVLRVA